jgi:hypothetical protein
MSQFQIADESITALWDGLARELDGLAPSQRAADAFLRAARCDFERMLADLSEDVLAGVIYPAPGTGKPILGIVLSDRFKGKVTCAAKRFHGLISH